MTLRTDLPNSSASLASGDKIGLLLVPPLVRSDRFVAERGVRLCFVPFPARVFVEGALGELEREPVRDPVRDPVREPVREPVRD